MVSYGSGIAMDLILFLCVQIKLFGSSCMGHECFIGSVRFHNVLHEYCQVFELDISWSISHIN